MFKPDVNSALRVDDGFLYNNRTSLQIAQNLDYLPVACPEPSRRSERNSADSAVSSHEFTGKACPERSRREQDPETALAHTLFRQYSSNLGRWMTPDPAGRRAVSLANPQTWNRYSYVGNNALNSRDPLGLCPVGGCYTFSAGGGGASFQVWTPDATVNSDAGVANYPGYWTTVMIERPSGGGSTNSARRARLNHAAKIALRNWAIGEAIAAGGGCLVGALVAIGATAATETWPLADATVAAGCVGGAMIGATEAFPYVTVGMFVEFGIDAWHEW